MHGSVGRKLVTRALVSEANASSPSRVMKTSSRGESVGDRQQVANVACAGGTQQREGLTQEWTESVAPLGRLSCNFQCTPTQ